MNRTLSLALARFVSGLVFWVISAVCAQPNPAYDPPPSYYSGTGGLTGAALKSALHQIIRNHTVIPYTSTSTDVWDALKVLDEDPANPANVLLVYSGAPVSSSSNIGNPHEESNDAQFMSGFSLAEISFVE